MAKRKEKTAKAKQKEQEKGRNLMRVGRKKQMLKFFRKCKNQAFDQRGEILSRKQKHRIKKRAQISAT